MCGKPRTEPGSDGEGISWDDDSVFTKGVCCVVCIHPATELARTGNQCNVEQGEDLLEVLVSPLVFSFSVHACRSNLCSSISDSCPPPSPRKPADCESHEEDDNDYHYLVNT